jgi:hypothetical protein
MNNCNTKINSEKDFNICCIIQNKLRINNPLYEPHCASYAVENYLKTVKKRLEEQMSAHPETASKIPKSIKIALNSLMNDKSILVKCADKNLGIVLVNKEWYKKEALTQLNDKTTYIKIEKAPTTNWFSTQIQQLLMKNNVLNPKFLDYILQFSKSKKKTINCKFYLTVKIHKNPIGARPIAASVGTPTYYLSAFLDKVLQPIIKKQITSYISNSSNLILKLHDANINLKSESYCLLTADVKSLYRYYSRWT